MSDTVDGSPPPVRTNFALVPVPIERFYDAEIPSRPGEPDLLEFLEYDHETLSRDRRYIQILFPLPEPSPVSLWAPLIDARAFSRFRQNTVLRVELCRAFYRMLDYFGLEALIIAPPRSLPSISTGMQDIDGDEQHSTSQPPSPSQNTADTNQALEVDGDEQYNTSQPASPSQNTADTNQVPEVNGDEQSNTSQPASPSQNTTDSNQTSYVATLLYTIDPSPDLFDLHSSCWNHHHSHNHLRITRMIRSLRILGCQAEAEAFYRAVKEVAETTNRISEESLGFWTRAARRKLSMPPEVESNGDEHGEWEFGEQWLKNLDDLVGDELAGKTIVWKETPNEMDGEAGFED